MHGWPPEGGFAIPPTPLSTLSGAPAVPPHGSPYMGLGLGLGLVGGSGLLQTEVSDTWAMSSPPSANFNSLSLSSSPSSPQSGPSLSSVSARTSSSQ